MLRSLTVPCIVAAFFLFGGCIAILNDQESEQQPLSSSALALVAMGGDGAISGTPSGGGTAGPAGATIVSSDGYLTLHIPEGAIQQGDENQEFTITRYTAGTSAMPGSYIPTTFVYQITPSYRFQKDVSVEISLNLATIQSNNLNQSATRGFSWSLTSVEDTAGRMPGWRGHESMVNSDKVVFSTRTFSLFGAGSPPPGNQPPDIQGAYYYFKSNCEYLPYRVRARVDEPNGDNMNVYLITGPANGGNVVIPMVPDGADWYRADIPYEAMVASGIEIQVTAVDEHGANTTVPATGTFLYPSDSGNSLYINNYSPDGDGDGYLDAWEVDNGYDPTNPASPSGILDSDGDGIPDSADHTPNGEANPVIDSLTIFPASATANVGEIIVFAAQASLAGQPRYVNASFVTTGNGRGGSPVGSMNGSSFTADHPGTAGVIVSVGPYNDTASVLVPDTIGPGDISDLVAFAPSHNRVRLEWTAPGNDGAAGKPAGYQIRRSSSPISNTLECFSAAMVAHSITPQVSGQIETLDVDGLSANTTYSFCVLAFDANGNFNNWTQGVVSVTTQTAPDLIAPANVTGATAAPLDSDAIRLSWTAVGDDGNVGSASSYEIRRSTIPINNDADCSNAGNVPNAVGPSGAGTPLQFDVTGLSDNTVYYFCIRAYDATNNRSSWTGFLSATTPDGNGAPVAVAGSDQETFVGYPLALDASSSGDPDAAACGANSGNYLYSWTLAQKPATSARTSADIQNSNSLHASFTPDVPGQYTLQFAFTDDAGACAGGNATSIDDLVLIANPVLAPLKTFQSQCWDAAGSIIPCAGTGQDGEHQAGRGVNFSGPNQHPTFGTDYTTTDHSTGLVWKSCSEGLHGPTCGSGSSLHSNRSLAANACSALNNVHAGAGYAGRTDWRIPTVKELYTIMNYDGQSPTGFLASFPGMLASSYWTSNMVPPPIVDFFWAPGFNRGRVNFTHVNDVSPSVLCVSPGPGLPSPEYIDHGDGTVTDRSTGLTWQKCNRGQNNDSTCTGTGTQQTWTDALAYCNSLNLAARNWRLPSVNELKSLANYSTANPAVNTSMFPGTRADFYWSATTVLSNTSRAWVVWFQHGTLDETYGKNELFRVQCVSD